MIEEINMSADDPEDSVHELLMLANYGDQPVARPILGTEEKIAAYSSEDLRAYWEKDVSPAERGARARGNYDWNAVVALAEKLLDKWSPDAFESRACTTNPVPVTLLTKEKDIEQIAHLPRLSGAPDRRRKEL